MHPNQHVTWSEKMIRQLITDRYPHLLSTFDAYPHFIMRVDLAKYIILHYYGGFYCDMDTKCKQNLHALTYLTSNDKVLLCRIVDDKRTKMYKRNFINNHFLYVPHRHHPFMTLMLQEIPKAAKRRRCEPMILHILRACGPGFLMNCIQKYKKRVEKERKQNHKAWPLCGGLQAEDVISVVRSDVLSNYVVHESSNTWLEKEWLDEKDKKLAFGGSAGLMLAAAFVVIIMFAI